MTDLWGPKPDMRYHRNRVAESLRSYREIGFSNAEAWRWTIYHVGFSNHEHPKAPRRGAAGQSATCEYCDGLGYFPEIEDTGYGAVEISRTTYPCSSNA